jgi:predicted transcriptional regulator
MLLPFAELLKWIDKRQKYLGWTNKVLAEKSKVPEGTIYRIKAGEEDCKFSTMRNILIALIGGTTDEFSCTEQVEKELRNMEQFEQQVARMASVEKENQELRQQLEECRELNVFLKKENERKAKIIDKYLD